MKKNFFRMFLAWSVAHFAGQKAQAVGWSDQATRLMHISGVLLDDFPVFQPPYPSATVGLKLDVTLLPTVNSKVGQEKLVLPLPRFRGIPLLAAEGAFMVSNERYFGVVPYFGVWSQKLRASGRADGKLNQMKAGADLFFLTWNEGDQSAYFSAGYHYSKSDIRFDFLGQNLMTDDFQTRNHLFSMAAGIKSEVTGLWITLMTGTRRGKNTLKIGDDGTIVESIDTLQDSVVPLFGQGSVGFQTPWGGHVAISELYVPSRAFVFRISMGWNYVFDKVVDLGIGK